MLTFVVIITLYKKIREEDEFADDFIIRMNTGDSIKLSKIAGYEKGKFKYELISITCEANISKCESYRLLRNQRELTKNNSINLLMYYDVTPNSVDFFNYQSSDVNWIGVQLLKGEITIESNNVMEDFCKDKKANNMTNIDYMDRKVKICQRSSYP